MRLLILALLLAQPPQAPPVRPPDQAPPVELFPRYDYAKEPSIIFVKCEPRGIYLAAKIYHEPHGLADPVWPVTTPTILVSPDGVTRIDLPSTASNADIAAALRKGVQAQSPAPFRIFNTPVIRGAGC